MLENEDINWKIWRTWQHRKEMRPGKKGWAARGAGLLAAKFNKTKTKAILNAGSSASVADDMPTHT